VRNDGLIRLTWVALHDLVLVHLISGLDEDTGQHADEDNVATVITGYTEWITMDNPAVTLGWDWQMLAAASQVALRRVGEPRSNLMVVNSAGKDLGHEKSSVLLETMIDEFAWQDTTLSWINDRYRAHEPREPDDRACA
jgi:hypothetical protein